VKWKPIITGVDGSPESFRAASFAWRIAQAADAQCILVYAVPDVGASDGVAPLGGSAAIFDMVVSALRDRIARELGSEIPEAVRQSLIARPGRPGAVLDAVTRESKGSLVVVGGRHHRALARGLGGSTAHHLVRTSRVPVLVVHDTAGAGLPRRMLVATDLFEAAGPTLSTARRYAELLEMQIRVVHVVEPAKFPTVVLLSLDMKGFAERSQVEFQRLLQLELPDVPSGERVVRRGRADEEIAEEAAAWNADLLVVGSHGRGWIDRLLIGSTTERLLNRLPTSLLVVPINEPATRHAARPARKGGHRRPATP
jgi:nucleotide-binding universal stress UspA family protein